MNNLVKKTVPGLAVLALLMSMASCNGTRYYRETVTPDHTLSGEDVYLIFTNTDPYTYAGAPPLFLDEARSADDTSDASEEIYPTRPEPSGRVDAQVWNNADLPKLKTGTAARSAGISFSYTSPSEDEDVGDTRTFTGAVGIDTVLDVPAECVAEVTDGTRNLLIYVATNDPVDPGITTDMVDALAVRFFDPSGDDDDIWDWCVDIFGEPWGPQDHYANMLDDGAQNDITILLYDIAGDNSTSGGFVGYFDSDDNITGYDTDERLMFAIDSVLYAQAYGGDADGDGDNWDVTDPWPQEVISTLAHEFQHMIHYYQKEIVHESHYSSDAWMNEMCSMVAEDLLAQKMGVPGPRGVDPDTAGPGTPGTTEYCRLNDYNLRPDTSLTLWRYTDPWVYYDYAASYSFGAYLARNYGGAELFRNIVQNTPTDYQAVLLAIQQTTGLSTSFEDLLIEWAVATFTSDEIAATETYNRGSTWVTTAGDSDLEYNLGSINLENYDNWVNNDTFQVWGPIPYAVNGAGTGYAFEELTDCPPASNTVVMVGTNLYGDYEWKVKVPEGVVVTVLTR